MSVVIKGMKYPESCYDCKVSCETESGLHCLLVDDGNKWGWKKIESGEKPDWCPLVELPKEHGRLIDADKLKSEFPYPKDWKDTMEAYVHKTGIWAKIACAETVLEGEG